MLPIISVLRFYTFLITFLFFFSSETIAQQLQLKIKSIDTLYTPSIDSLGYKNRFDDYNSMKTEVDLLQLKLYQEGYINNKIITLKKNNDSLFNATFQLNNKYKDLLINYDSKTITQDILKSIHPKVNDSTFSIPFNQTERILNFINQKLTEKGTPFTKSKLSQIKVKDKNTLEASLIIIENESKRGLDKIIIKGYKKFPKSYLKHYLKIKPQKTFNINSINQKIKGLNNLPFANQIKPPEVLFTKDSTILYMYVKKNQSNSFDGFLGFNTNENTNKLEFNGYLNLRLNNNFNYGESFNILYKSDENEQTRFEANLNMPYLFKTPIGTEFELNLFKKDSTFNTVSQKAKLYYQLNNTTRILTGIDFSESNLLLEQDDANSIKDYKSNFYTLSFNYEKPNQTYSIFPVQSVFLLEAGFGKRVETTNTQNQTKIGATISHIFNLNKKNSIFGKLDGNWLTSDTFLENELFRFGGINSIRGFEENSLVADLFATLNTEYRYQLNSTIYLHSIIDFGYFDNALSKQQENLYGFGVGFGFITKAGLLKFNFANGKTQNQQFKFSNSKTHISLIALF